MDEKLKERIILYFGAIASLALIIILKDTLESLFSILGIGLLIVGWLLVFALLEVLRRNYGFGIFLLIGKEGEIPDRAVKLATGAAAVIAVVELILVLMWYMRSSMLI
ncbi:MAG TPA: hypothetical protein VJI13_05785 [Candidatus Norongarragalinales archaeon]|nr:hypothetical protein [Candidatus Norongarragalinales archaeon]